MFSKTSCPNCKLKSYEKKKSILYQRFISPICFCKIVIEERVSRVLRWPPAGCWIKYPNWNWNWNRIKISLEFCNRNLFHPLFLQNSNRGKSKSSSPVATGRKLNYISKLKLKSKSYKNKFRILQQNLFHPFVFAK